jgi:hypothetical protein
MRIYGTGQESELSTVCSLVILSSQPPKEARSNGLGSELRREEQLLTQTGMYTDRDGTVDDVSEGAFHLNSPLAPARPESQKSRGQASPPRRAQAYQPSG